MKKLINNLTLAKKMFVSPLITLIFMFVLFFWAYYGLKSQNNSLDEIFNVRYSMSMKSLKIISDIRASNTAIYKAISWVKGEYPIERVNPIIKENTVLIENIAKNMEQIAKSGELTTEERKKYVAALAKYKEYQAIAMDMLSFIAIDVNTATLAMNLCDEKFVELEKAMQEIINIEQKMSQDKYNFSAKNFKFVILIFIVVAVLAIGLSILTNLVIAHLATAGITQTISAVEIVAHDGNLTVPVTVTSQDEIGKLANAVETMRVKMEDAVGQTSVIAVKLAESASEGAASIEETSASLSEISNMIAQNAKTTNEANSLMAQAAQEIKKANDHMQDLTKSMNEIGQASERAQKIVKNIDEIAFQTNLLALNAAVEAARAGEAGAGFAVVADEVRNLAMRATESAKNTSELITDIVVKIKDGNEFVNTTSQVFGQVLASTHTVVELMNSITNASQEQTQGIGQIDKAVRQMNIVTQQNAGSAEELAASMSVFKTTHSTGKVQKKIFTPPDQKRKALLR